MNVLVLARAHGLVTYVWHYVVARLIYDHLVRPLTRGIGPVALAALAAIGLAVLLLKRRRRPRQRAEG